MPGFGSRKRSPAPSPRAHRHVGQQLLAGLPPEDPAAPWKPPFGSFSHASPGNIPSLKKIDQATAPEAKAPIAALVAAATGGSGLLAEADLSSRLEDLTGLALDRARDILQSPVDPDSEYYADELRAQTSTIKTTLVTQVRVDENKLRRRELDIMPKLLKAIAEEERRMGVV